MGETGKESKITKVTQTQVYQIQQNTTDSQKSRKAQKLILKNCQSEPEMICKQAAALLYEIRVQAPRPVRKCKKE